MGERAYFPRMLVAVLALLGLFDAAYLTLARLDQRVDLVCPVGGGCAIVQASSWSTLPPGSGIPLAYVGLAGYGTLLVVALRSLHAVTIGPLAAPALLLALATVALLMAIYLSFLQVAVIGAICAWCAGSAVLSTGIWLVAWIDWREWCRARVASGNAG